MGQSFKVIEVKINEHDGVSYDYVTRIDVDHHGKIVIVTSPDVLNAMKFMVETTNKEFIIREQMLNLVKSYFSKNNYTISYRTLAVEVKLKELVSQNYKVIYDTIHRQIRCSDGVRKTNIKRTN